MQNIGRFIKHERLKQNIDQQHLCEGICSNSYLSKIENGETHPNDEIIHLLVEQLDYSYINTVDENFESFRDKIWKQVLFFEDFSLEWIGIAQSYILKYRFSNYATDIYLVENLLFLYENKPFLNDNLKYLALNSFQRYTYDYLSLQRDFDSTVVNILDSHYNDSYGLLDYYRALKQFILGKYYDTIQTAQTAFRKFSLHGNINGMIDVSFLEANAYSNLNNLLKQVEVSQRILNLNQSVNSDKHASSVYYNLGSAYTVKKDFKNAKYNLLKALEYGKSSNEDLSLIYEKLLFNAIFEQNETDYLTYLDHYSHNNNGHIVQLFQVIYKHHYDLTNAEVIKNLELCLQIEGEVHHGRMMLFGILLYDSYRKTYQYPKALNLLERLNVDINGFWKREA